MFKRSDQDSRRSVHILVDGTAVEAREIREVVTGAQVAINGQVAGQVSDETPCGETVAMAVDAEDRRAPAGRPQQIEQQPDRRRLAGAVGSEQSDDLALLGGEAQPVDGGPAAVALAQVGGFEGRHGPTVGRSR